MANRWEVIEELYAVLDRQRERCGGFRCLAECSSTSGWPKRGVYFFFEPGEVREECDEPRVVRVGTHALKLRSATTLWDRLAQHRGQLSGRHPGGGNHRGSIFRRHVGAALIARGSWPSDSTSHWLTLGKGIDGLRDLEYPIEQAVSAYIGAMPFLWFDVPDDPGPSSERGLIERNAIALLSNVGKDPIDPPSADWLGHDAPRSEIRESGLWNVRHVHEAWSPEFIDLLAAAVAR